ncbi:response regulator transcription factor [Cohnella massiliensis]|uniref:response regulator transcription factor n=1 Tax=Cohnella massiliensis TaxID=1816691 RepID=UPI0009BC6BF5|nr:response regulator transcription factor [Cohnella massiliensis]
MRTILVVEDEPKIRQVVTSYLIHGGYQVEEAESGHQTLALLERTSVDLILLDLMLPDISGEVLCQQIRARSSIPIIMLTAKSAKSQQVHGLEIGADDYIVKPFDPAELLARIRAVLRRTNEEDVLADRIVSKNGELVVDSVRNEVLLKDQPVPLTGAEYKLLLVFVRHPCRTFSREELIEKIHSLDFEGDTRTIDQHIKNIRQKIETDPKKPTYIQTVYGVGYRYSGG